MANALEKLADSEAELPEEVKRLLHLMRRETYAEIARLRERAKTIDRILRAGHLQLTKEHFECIMETDASP